MTKAIIPAPADFLREAMIVVGGALIAALVLSKLPAVRAFIQNNTTGGCDCSTH